MKRRRFFQILLGLPLLRLLPVPDQLKIKEWTIGKDEHFPPGSISTLGPPGSGADYYSLEAWDADTDSGDGGYILEVLPEKEWQRLKNSETRAFTEMMARAPKVKGS